MSLQLRKHQYWKRRFPVAFAILFSTTCLLVWGADNATNTSALIEALENRDIARAKRIIGSGIDMNVRDQYGRTPLTEAIADHFPNLAIEMMRKGADVNFPSLRSNTPLMSAAWYCEQEALDALISRGAKVNAHNDDGETALVYASANCKGGDEVHTLLHAGADPNAATKDGYTPLIVAADSGNETATKQLIAAGADVNTKNVEGESALSIAKEHPFGTDVHHRIYILLQNASKK